MKKGFLIALVIGISILSNNCNNDENIDEPIMKKYSISGLIQKGPFINGTDITISELKSNLSETGRTFQTNILDDKGTFEVPELELESGYVRIKADGFYYNEIEGTLSDSRIVLYAIVDLSTTQTINVNVVTSLESERVKTLVSEEVSFSEAKSRAKNEVYGIFGFNSNDSLAPELFDITKDGEDNSILLAISTIILGTNSSAEMTNLISTITTDIKEDGVLNNQDAQSQLINEATFLDFESIKSNLLSRYSDLGQSIEINNFEYYVEQFIDSTNYIFTKIIVYPTMADGYLNILSDTTIIYEPDVKYCFAAYLPAGTQCIVKYNPGGPFGIVMNENNGWTMKSLPDYWKELSAEGDDKSVSVPAVLGGGYTYTVEIFIYENGSEIPAFSKVIGI